MYMYNDDKVSLRSVLKNIAVIKIIFLISYFIIVLLLQKYCFIFIGT